MSLIQREAQKSIESMMQLITPNGNNQNCLNVKFQQHEEECETPILFESEWALVFFKHVNKPTVPFHKKDKTTVWPTQLSWNSFTTLYYCVLPFWWYQYFWAEVLLEGIRWLAFVSGAKVSLRFQHHKEVSQFLQIFFFTSHNHRKILCFESHSPEISPLLVSAMKTAVGKLYL